MRLQSGSFVRPDTRLLATMSSQGAAPPTPEAASGGTGTSATPDAGAGAARGAGAASGAATGPTPSAPPLHFRLGKQSRDFKYWQVGPVLWECVRGNLPDHPNMKLFLMQACPPRDAGYKWIAGHCRDGTPPADVPAAITPVFASPDDIFEGMGETYHRWTWWEDNKWASEEWMYFLPHDLRAA